MNLRILHCTSGNLFGGIEANLISIARTSKQLQQNEHGFLTCFKGKVHNALLATGAPVFNVPSPRLRYPWTLWNTRRHASPIIEQWDVIVVHSLWPWIVYGPEIQRQKKKHTLWIHDTFKPWDSIPKKAMKITPAHLLANSEFVLEGLRQWKDVTKFDLVHYPIPPSPKIHSSTRQETRNNYRFKDDQTIILAVSRIDPWKGLPQLIEIVSKLSAKNARLCIVGAPQTPTECTHFKQLENLRESLNCRERVQFLGAKTPSEVRELMAASDIFCQANKEPEPFGIVFVEALYSSLPIITFNMGGAKEIISQSTGFLVQNTQEFVKRLDQLCTDKILRDTLAAAGPHRASNLCEPQNQLLKLEACLGVPSPQKRVPAAAS